MKGKYTSKVQVPQIFKSSTWVKVLCSFIPPFIFCHELTSSLDSFVCGLACLWVAWFSLPVALDVSVSPSDPSNTELKSESEPSFHSERARICFLCVLKLHYFHFVVVLGFMVSRWCFLLIGFNPKFCLMRCWTDEVLHYCRHRLFLTYKNRYLRLHVSRLNIFAVQWKSVFIVRLMRTLFKLKLSHFL